VPYGVTNPRQVFNLAAVCALSGTNFAAFAAQPAVGTLNHKSHQVRSTTLESTVFPLDLKIWIPVFTGMTFEA
jgi:hypothetical protein